MDQEKSLNNPVTPALDFCWSITKVSSILRINFTRQTRKNSTVNAGVTVVFFCVGVYTVLYNMRVTFAKRHTPLEIATQLLIVMWAIQSLVSVVFFVYWQVRGHLQEFREALAECQSLSGVREGHGLLRNNNRVFVVTIFFEIVVTLAFAFKYHYEQEHTEFAKLQSMMFYWPELRPIYTMVTTYLYLVWNCTLFLLITYVNATYLEIAHFNMVTSQMDGSDDGVESNLLRHFETYGKLLVAIRKLDELFRLYVFIMISMAVPSMIFTLMMMNGRIRSVADLLICLPSICLCVFSFFAVTVSPARLHDEISQAKAYLCENKSLWIPYRSEVYLIGNTMATHMDQDNLGVTIWGFAVLSRPLILATLSATAMMLSLLTELAPKSDLFMETITSDEHHRP